MYNYNADHTLCSVSTKRIVNDASAVQNWLLVENHWLGHAVQESKTNIRFTVQALSRISIGKAKPVSHGSFIARWKILLDGQEMAQNSRLASVSSPTKHMFRLKGPQASIRYEVHIDSEKCTTSLNYLLDGNASARGYIPLRTRLLLFFKC